MLKRLLVLNTTLAEERAGRPLHVVQSDSRPPTRSAGAKSRGGGRPADAEEDEGLQDTSQHRTGYDGFRNGMCVHRGARHRTHCHTR